MRDIAPGRPLVFTHVPKTAGTSLIAALTDALRPVHPFEGFDRGALADFSDFDQLSPELRSRMVLGPDDLPAEADAVFGHISPSTTRARYRAGSWLTVLREPRSRLVSHWLFSRAHTDRMLRGLGTWAHYVKAARLPLVEYLGDPSLAFCTDNLMLRALVGPHELAPFDRFIGEDAEEALLAEGLASLDAFDFAGVVDDPDLPIQLSGWLGRPIAMQRSNESPLMPKGLQCDVIEECRRAGELVVHHSRLDATLWDHIAVRSLVRGTGDAAPMRDRIYDASVARWGHIAAAPRPPLPTRARVFVSWAAGGVRRRASRAVRGSGRHPLDSSR
jgi:hypothetical protein